MSDFLGFGYILALWLFVGLTMTETLQAPLAFLVSVGVFLLFSFVFRTIFPGEIWRNLPDKPSRK